MKVKSESEVAQLCPTLSDPMDCGPPGSSIHGIFQARVLEWGAIAFFEMALQMLYHFWHKWTNRDNTSTLWHQAEHHLLDTLVFSQRSYDV